MKLINQKVINQLVWAQFFLHFLVFFILFLTIFFPFYLPDFMKIYNFHVFDAIKEELMIRKGLFPDIQGHLVLGMIIVKLVAYILILLRKKLGISLLLLIIIGTFFQGITSGDDLSIAWMKSIDYVSVTIDGMLLALLLFTDIKKKF